MVLKNSASYNENEFNQSVENNVTGQRLDISDLNPRDEIHFTCHWPEQELPEEDFWIWKNQNFMGDTIGAGGTCVSFEDIHAVQWPAVMAMKEEKKRLAKLFLQRRRNMIERR